jgi:hypothetical protein
VLYAIVWGYESWRDGVVAEGDAQGAGRVQDLWNKDKVARAAAAAKEVAKAREDEQEKAREAVKGERHAREQAESRAAAAAAAANRATAAVGGLSGNIAALDRAARALDLPSAAACPGEFGRQRDAAIRARALLGACAARHRDLAEAADGAVGAVTLKLDTALGYIRAVAPP